MSVVTCSKKVRDVGEYDNAVRKVHEIVYRGGVCIPEGSNPGRVEVGYVPKSAVVAKHDFNREEGSENTHDGNVNFQVVIIGENHEYIKNEISGKLYQEGMESVKAEPITPENNKHLFEELERKGLL